MFFFNIKNYFIKKKTKNTLLYNINRYDFKLYNLINIQNDFFLLNYITDE